MEKFRLTYVNLKVYPCCREKKQTVIVTRVFTCPPFGKGLWNTCNIGYAKPWAREEKPVINTVLRKLLPVHKYLRGPSD